MAHFLDVDRGYINLDYVTQVRRERTGNTTFFAFIGRKDEILGTLTTQSISADDLSPRFVAAAPDAYAFVVSVPDGPDAPDYEIGKAPICAWQLTPCSSGNGGPGFNAVPVFPEDQEGTNYRWFLPYPDGTVVSPFDQTFPSIEAAATSFAKSVRERTS